MNRVPRRRQDMMQRQTVSVFVGHLALGTTEKTLYDLFKGCGEIVQVFIQALNQKTSFTYGFVRFKTKEAADNAVRDLDGWLVNGLTIRVEISDQSKEGEQKGPRPSGSNEEYLNLSKLMHVVAETAKASEARRDREVLDPERVLKEVSETENTLVPLISHPARRSLDLDQLDLIASTTS